MASWLGYLEVEDNSPLRQKGQQRFLIDKGDALDGGRVANLDFK